MGIQRTLLIFRLHRCGRLSCGTRLCSFPFGHTVETGSHQQSLEAVIVGEADVAAIDSIVFERALQLDPSLHDRIQTLLAIGPNPVPPMITARPLAPDIVTALRQTLLEMHHHPAGQEVLAQAQISHFVAVSDSMYDPIRHQITASSRVQQLS